jgi:hypothetical protein
LRKRGAEHGGLKPSGNGCDDFDGRSQMKITIKAVATKKNSKKKIAIVAGG